MPDMTPLFVEKNVSVRLSGPGKSDMKNDEHEYIKDFFFDKPTFRKLTSQVSYFEHVEYETVINSKLEETDELSKKLNAIKQRGLPTYKYSRFHCIVTSQSNS